MCVCECVFVRGNGRNNCFAVLMKQIAVEKNFIMSHHFLSTGNSYTSSLDENTTNIIYDPTEEIDTTTSKLMTTTSASVSSTTMESTTFSTTTEDDYSDNDDFTTILSRTEAPTTTTFSITVPPTTSSTTTVKTTTSIIEGSGSGYKVSTKSPQNLYDDEDYDNLGSGSDV
ncbi:hypothetical protein ACKWTF_006597 [Chironomus riparius]